MATRLPWMAGTAYDSKRAAALLAVKSRDNVVFEFNGEEYTITQDEARAMMPALMVEALERLDNVKTDFNREFAFAKSNLIAVIEAKDSMNT